MRTRSHRSNLIGVAATALVLSTAGMAIAGALPAPAQDAISNAMKHAGITLPSSTDQTSGEHPTADDHPGTQGPAATGEEISSLATTTDAQGVDKGAAISGLATGGTSRAGADHPSAGQASASPAAGEAGDPVADQASSGTSDFGSGIAATESGGRSVSGSGDQSIAPRAVP